MIFCRSLLLLPQLPWSLFVRFFLLDILLSTLLQTYMLIFHCTLPIMLYMYKLFTNLFSVIKCKLRDEHYSISNHMMWSYPIPIGWKVLVRPVWLWGFPWCVSWLKLPYMIFGGWQSFMYEKYLYFRRWQQI